jgi:hypothetical protein
MSDFDFDQTPADGDQPGQELDESVSAEFPPDRPLGVYDAEATGVEDPDGEPEESDEPLGDELEPEAWEAPGAAGTPPVLEGDADVDAVDVEKDLVAPPGEASDIGALSADDEFAGDETTRDYATERVPAPAEEAAVRTTEDVPGATG